LSRLFHQPSAHQDAGNCLWPMAAAVELGAKELGAELLSFWFEASTPSQWFIKDPAFDHQVRERFIGLTRQAVAGELATWGEQPLV
jgi:uncharacterized protein (DUF924 family)